MKHQITKKEKRRLLLFSLIFLFIITFTCINILPDWFKIMSNNKEIKVLESSYNNLLDKEVALKAEVEKLHNSEYVERYAREKYLYTKNNELIIRKTATKD